MAQRNPRLLFVLSSAALLGACAQFPALDRTITPAMEAAPYPDLVPIEPLLAQAEAGSVDPLRTEAALTGRAAGLQARARRVDHGTTGAASAARVERLKARAARLRGAGLSGAERERLQEEPAL